jgi:hypothetical protein
MLKLGNRPAPWGSTEQGELINKQGVKMTNEDLLEITKSMPMRQIDVKGKPYLQRYFAGTTTDDYDIFIHRFLSADGDEHLHSHPRESYSFVMIGEYSENINGVNRVRPGRGWLTKTQLLDMLSNQPSGAHDLLFRLRGSGFVYCAEPLTPFDYHRIVSVEPETWSLFVVGPQILPYWYFKEPNGDIVPVKSSPRDWWKSCKPRID